MTDKEQKAAVVINIAIQCDSNIQIWELTGTENVTRENVKDENQYSYISDSSTQGHEW